MTPLERAARAVADYTAQRMPPHGDIVTCEGIACAVLQAIREPSEGMVQAGGCAIYDRRDDALSVHLADEAWQAMIDAALSE